MKPGTIKFTIGMATAFDFEGVYFTTQALSLYHRNYIGEILIIDNYPESKDSEHLKGIAANNSLVRYVPFNLKTGTAAPRDEIFRQANFEHVVVLDSHVLLVGGALKALSNYYQQNPGTKDLIQGPLLADNLKTVFTHFDDQWGAGMKGKWATDNRVYQLPHFPIPAQGLGLFASRRDSWLGFNPRFRGFGGEEHYIHEKYRQNGRQTICLSQLIWLHRFTRVAGVPYPLDTTSRIINYTIGFKELGRNDWLSEVKDHFKITDAQWVEYMKVADGLADHYRPPQEDPATCVPCSENVHSKHKDIEQAYEIAHRTPSDINEHCPVLKEMASKCDTVVEFGVRTGVSTTALLAGRPKRLISFDINDSYQARSLEKIRPEGSEFNFYIGNSLQVNIPECDMLFIDTKHTGQQVYSELIRHASKVRKWIAFHDTTIFGENGEDGSPGLMFGIRKFLEDNPNWFTIKHYQNNHGFTVISRVPEEAPKRLPNMLKMAVNYASSEAKDILNGRKRVSLEVAQQRYDICTSNGGRCPLEQRQIDTDRCAGCGCWLWEQKDDKGKSLGEMTGKVWRPLDYCPFGLWGTSNPEDENLIPLTIA